MPIDTVDFSSYLTTLKPADCTYNWIFGNGTGPFIKQYHDYGLKAPLVLTMADDLQEPTMQELGDMALGIVGEDHYLSTMDNPLNKKFVAEYAKMWPGELPNMDSYGGYTAVMMFLEAVKQTNGDTSPDALKKVLATLSMDTPSGKITMSPYGTAFIGTGRPRHLQDGAGGRQLPLDARSTPTSRSCSRTRGERAGAPAVSAVGVRPAC